MPHLQRILTANRDLTKRVHSDAPKAARHAIVVSPRVDMKKLVMRTFAIVVVLCASSANAGLGDWFYGESWQFMEAVGGVAIDAPVRNPQGNVYLPVRCDVAGIQTITKKPTTINSALTVKSIDKKIEKEKIYISIHTGLASKDESSACSGVDLGDVPAGAYEVFYRGSDREKYSLGSVTVPLATLNYSPYPDVAVVLKWNKVTRHESWEGKTTFIHISYSIDLKSDDDFTFEVEKVKATINGIASSGAYYDTIVSVAPLPRELTKGKSSFDVYVVFPGTIDVSRDIDFKILEFGLSRGMNKKLLAPIDRTLELPKHPFQLQHAN